MLSKYNSQVLSLDDALSMLNLGTLPSNSAVITIDDGFYNVLSVAQKILEPYRYPATLYLTTYYVENNNPIFRLVVQYMFWKTKMQTVDLTDCSWANDTEIDISNNKTSNRVIWDCINYGEKKCSENERTHICRQLGVLLGVSYNSICKDRILSLLSAEDAKILSHKNCNIQLHTHRHRLPIDNKAETQKEIIDNRIALEKIVPYPTMHFCYPSGIWDKAQWPWLEQVGVKSATTCLPGLNSNETSVFGLTRFLDGENISNIEFKAELFGFSELLRNIRSAILASVK